MTTAISLASPVRPLVQRAPRVSFHDTPAMDFLFALGPAALFLGRIVGPGKTFLFIAVAALVFTVYLPQFLKRGVTRTLIAPALGFFLAVHLALALRLGVSTFLIKSTQVAVAAAYLGPFVTHYSRRPMTRFAIYAGSLLGLLLAYTIAWHVLHGFWSGWKRFYETKSAFTWLPFALVAMLNAPTHRVRRIGALLFPVLAVIILLSGERKAYILLGISPIFFLGPRNPLTYLLPLGAMVLGPVAAALDQSGYVARQVDTLGAFAQGEVVQTLSNLQREWTMRYALELFREQPILGLGTNGYVEVLNAHYGAAPKDQQIIVPNLGIHGEFLRVLVENGVVGFFALITLLSTSLWAILVRAGGRLRPLKSVRLPLFCFLTLLIHLSLEAFDTISLLAYCALPFLASLQFTTSPGTVAAPVASASGKGAPA